ncbi:MAG: outer membrane beta-barrel protein [Chitinophagaceae bacterium]|nr:outer membrane beta-barrel protein [Chitinophagaceae bacterium]
MKKFLWGLLLTPFAGFAQPFHITAWGGFSGYQGDLQTKRITVQQSNFAFGLGVKYDLSGHIALRSGLNFGKVEANDNKNSDPFLVARNLSFQSRIVEGNVAVEYSLFDLRDRKLSPYVFAGVGLFHFNPSAYDTLGNKVFLKPLSTEGQGLSQYPSSKEYKLTQFNIPFGAGLRLKVTENVSLGYEVGFRKLFTDYLDDVSNRYVDQATLLQERGAKAVEMAFRGGELKNSTAVYPADGTIRGGSKFKDWYYFHGITVTVGLQSNKSDSKRGSVGCPNLW